MKISLIGYGKMGQIIRKTAESRGHQIAAIIDINNPDDVDSPAFLGSDVAIEFTTPATAFNNYIKCFERNIPVVSGTTGWTTNIDRIKKMCEEEGKTFFYSSNFSIGVNILFALNKQLAKIMNRFPNYDVEITETHHIHKLDAPSGTAITLAEGILDNLDRKKEWKLEKTDNVADDLLIHAIREGEVPGIHEIKYESEADFVSIRHEAKNRSGFALGAVLAAEFVQGKKGFFGMNDLLHF